MRADSPLMSPQQADCQWCEKSRQDGRSACTGCGRELTRPMWSVGLARFGKIRNG